ncbi:unnamed protein product [Choristocarpus tenellus]
MLAKERSEGGDDDHDDVVSDTSQESAVANCSKGIELTYSPKEEIFSESKGRISSGCSLWDLSVSRLHASFMLRSGLVGVVCSVLQQCEAADSAQQLCQATDEGERVDRGAEKGGIPCLTLEEVTRLREIACGIVANTCTHPSLR